MRGVVFGMLLGTLLPAHAPRAYFAHVTVSAARPTTVRGTWRPGAVALGPDIDAQQRQVHARARITHPDSLRRWRDTTSRDTVVLMTPFEFTVDMTAGPVVLHALGADSIRAAVQLVPMGGRVAVEWGRVIRLPRTPLFPLFWQKQ